MDIRLDSAFAANTMLVKGDSLVNIASLKLLISPLEMFALNDEKAVITTNLTRVIETYETDLWYIELSNGFKMECIPTTTLLTRHGFKRMYELTPKMMEDNDIISIYCKESEMKGIPLQVVKSEPVKKILATPVYFFEAVHNNILLPYYVEDDHNNVLTLVCTHQ